MSLQEFLEDKFRQWSPPAPQMVTRTKHSVTLTWDQTQPFQFITDHLLYRIEKNDKIPPWHVVYRGGKTIKEIDNLAPRYPHKFRLKVILKAEARHMLADRAVQMYGHEQAVYDCFSNKDNVQQYTEKEINEKGDVKVEHVALNNKIKMKMNEQGDARDRDVTTLSPASDVRRDWLESVWSAETWTSTDPDGSSASCFCMAVRCGYLKQVQGMLEERPELIGILNPTNGFPPLTIAVRKGDISMARFLISAGAWLDQPSATGQTALHVAVLTGRLPMLELLLEKGADYQARDCCGLRAEHYAADSGDVRVLRRVMELGGDVCATDGNGWTPLFRASHLSVAPVCQGAAPAVVEELLARGSDVHVVDAAGLPLLAAARAASATHREAVLRLVDAGHPRRAVRAHFARVARKIHHVHSLLKLPSLAAKPLL